MNGLRGFAGAQAPMPAVGDIGTSQFPAACIAGSGTERRVGMAGTGANDPLRTLVPRHAYGSRPALPTQVCAVKP
jgi:hypothetical protein